MEFLPPPAEMEWIREELGALVDACGWEMLVRAHTVEASPRFFPERWEAAPRSASAGSAAVPTVRRLLRRCLKYAELRDLDVRVKLFEEDRAPASAHVGTAAYFAGIERGVCTFGVNTDLFEDPEKLVGAIAHEVAHAFRANHGLVRDDRALEERLTDLTTVFLGFGVLSTNSAYRHQSSGGATHYQVRTSQAGYLSPQALAYALALHAIARRGTASELKAIAKLLETNQRAFFKAACKKVGKDPDSVPVMLGVPPRAAWPEATSMDELVAWVSAEIDADERGVEARDPEAPASTPALKPTHLVFRVRHTKAAPYTFLGTIGGFVVAVALVRGVDAPASVTLACAVALAGLGYVLGRRKRSDFCSEPSCEVALGDETTRCPKCGGKIAGAIRRQRDRLEAEEALERDPHGW